MEEHQTQPPPPKVSSCAVTNTAYAGYEGGSPRDLGQLVYEQTKQKCSGNTSLHVVAPEGCVCLIRYQGFSQGQKNRAFSGSMRLKIQIPFLPRPLALVSLNALIRAAFASDVTSQLPLG